MHITSVGGQNQQGVLKKLSVYRHFLWSESIEQCIEDHASYDLASLNPSPKTGACCQSSFCHAPTELGRGGVGEEPKHLTARNPGPLSIIQ